MMKSNVMVETFDSLARACTKYTSCISRNYYFYVLNTVTSAQGATAAVAAIIITITTRTL